MPIVSDDVLKLSQPAVIVLFAPMLMHLLQYILFLSLSYVNHDIPNRNTYFDLQRLFSTEIIYLYL
jgi:hypothetical protein